MFLINSPLTIYVADWPVQMTEKASNVELFENVYEHIPRSLCPYYVNSPVYRRELR